MKRNLKLGRAFLAFALLTLTINLNAGTRVISAMDLPGNEIPNVGRVEFTEFELESDSTEAMRFLSISPTGTANITNIFQRVLVLDDTGSIVARQDKLDQRGFLLDFSKAVLKPHIGRRFRLAADSHSGLLESELAKTIGLQIQSIDIARGLNAVTGGAFPIGGRVRTVTNRVIGYFTGIQWSTDKQHIGSALLGKDSVFLGRIYAANISSQGISVGRLPFEIYATGGLPWDVQSIVGRNSEGNDVAGVANAYARAEYGAYELVSLGQSAITFPNGTPYLDIYGKIGSSFSRGGTVALVTDPNEWRNVRDIESGFGIPLPNDYVDLYTVAGPTITVVPPRLTVTVEVTGLREAKAGAKDQHVLSYWFDTEGSGEPINVADIPLQFYTLLPEWKSHIARIRFINMSTGATITHDFSPASYEDRNAIAVRDRIAVNYPNGADFPTETLTEVRVLVDFTPNANGVYAFALLQEVPSAKGAKSNLPVAPSITYGWTIVRVSP